MSTPTPNESRFQSQNKSTQERISNTTVGLVTHADFRKRRAEVLEQQEREASGAPVDRSLTTTPDPAATSGAAQVKKQAKKRKVTKLSFDDDGEEEGAGDDTEDGAPKAPPKSKFKANASVAVVPRAMTKAALRREAAERESLRKEFLERQEAVKATEIAIPFVFYDGSNIPGGTVRVKKGDFVWVFLDKSRKVGADLGVGEKANARREWARVGVDDLMIVRGNIIIPHKRATNWIDPSQHYDFLYFIMNKTTGPNDKRLFDYTNEAPPKKTDNTPIDPLSTAASRAAKAAEETSKLEGASDDPTYTKVVDRRWYERNKHIYPASVWQEFDAEKDYRQEVRRDLGGNTFFYS
ncbi:putative XAP5, circadian clock regulator-domain-containing protein [Seiridium unicorne]|uniref:XAP5, circadian clock regulator-domain-containing protein n=1 Tax=Seiridium unicorne TaxID=138068 RepID=A0ABR2UXP3_9PEZI